jgi:hypothetical protein
LSNERSKGVGFYSFSKILELGVLRGGMGHGAHGGGSGGLALVSFVWSFYIASSLFFCFPSFYTQLGEVRVEREREGAGEFWGSV